MRFTDFHTTETPLLMANVWDVNSALIARDLGYQALGTSSAAIAATTGYADGEAMPFDLLLQVVQQITAQCDCPLSVDMEAGYGQTPEKITAHLIALTRLGVTGVNLEDSHVIKGERHPDETIKFAAKLKKIREALANVTCPLFLNIRTDSFLLRHPNALQESVCRGQAYAAAGADGFFVPGAVDKQAITTLARDVPLPLNVMCFPGLADFGQLAEWGVRRISMGNFVYAAVQDMLYKQMSAIQSNQTFAGLFHDGNC